jgi:hypothetical protein
LFRVNRQREEPDVQWNAPVAQKRSDSIEELAIGRLVGKDEVVPAFQRDEFRARNAGGNLLSLTEWQGH